MNIELKTVIDCGPAHHHACQCREASFTRIEVENFKFRETLRTIVAMAGHPEAAEGCRPIMNLAKEVLQDD